MSVDKVLAELLALRRGHEQRALDLLTQREAELWRAEETRATADDKAQQHQADAQAREREELRALQGRPVSSHDILGLQDRLDAMAAEQGQLKAAAETARQDLAERASARDDARTAFRTRQRATEKLALLAGQRARETGRRQAALADDADDEKNTRGASGVPPGGRRA
ncbi:MAG: hypothetical protein JOY90_01620 [Bradyrhizobium sp.]|uniref:hypothetical protein n=1 Tax=Bradyrhizobium sp. TaxID=376 RepID=UPI001DC7DC82|nr:hypothetical protein [Bradyrhizobium sp.]MBV9559152.1 hypothetical protein [Bradyrhizobium sp.]